MKRRTFIINSSIASAGLLVTKLLPPRVVLNKERIPLIGAEHRVSGLLGKSLLTTKMMW